MIFQTTAERGAHARKALQSYQVAFHFTRSGWSVVSALIGVEIVKRDVAMKRLRHFTFSAELVFAVTGAAKLLSASGWGRVLETPDPIFGIPSRVVLLVVGGVELLVALACFLASGTAGVRLSGVLSSHRLDSAPGAAADGGGMGRMNY